MISVVSGWGGEGFVGGMGLGFECVGHLTQPSGVMEEIGHEYCSGRFE